MWSIESGVWSVTCQVWSVKWKESDAEKGAWRQLLWDDVLVIFQIVDFFSLYIYNIYIHPLRDRIWSLFCSAKKRAQEMGSIIFQRRKFGINISKKEVNAWNDPVWEFPSPVCADEFLWSHLMFTRHFHQNFDRRPGFLALNTCLDSVIIKPVFFLRSLYYFDLFGLFWSILYKSGSLYIYNTNVINYNY